MTLSKPAITVAVPTCNGARHLAEALRSILAQDLPFDLIVVDDRSDDDTLAVARAVAGDRARVEVNSERLGLAGNWNRCVALSQTPQVAIFHQDDVMYPGHLATHVAAYRSNPSFGWVASQADVIDDAGQPVPESVVERGGLGPVDRDFPSRLEGDGLEYGSQPRELTLSNPLRCSAVTIGREAHRMIDGFDPSYRYVVDWNYWIRVASFCPIAWRAAPTVAIRWHSASETHRFATGTADLDETARLLDWLAPGIDPEMLQEFPWRPLAHGRLARAYLNRAYTAARAGHSTLVRRAVARAFRTAPGAVASHLVRDPRLVARLVLALVRPARAADPRPQPTGPKISV